MSFSYEKLFFQRGFVKVSDLSVKDYKTLQGKFRVYPTTVLTVAIFYSLPVIQLVVQYQINIDSIGNEDICYFNFLCTRELFNFTAFNNILSNLGYCALGVLFFVVVHRRYSASDSLVHLCFCCLETKPTDGFLSNIRT